MSQTHAFARYILLPYALEDVEYSRQMGLINPSARVADYEDVLIGKVIAVDFHCSRTIGRHIFDRVVQQVKENLLHGSLVCDGIRQGAHIYAHSAITELMVQRLQGFADQFIHVQLFQGKAAATRSGQIKNRINKTPHLFRGGVDELQSFDDIFLQRKPYSCLFLRIQERQTPFQLRGRMISIPVLSSLEKPFRLLRGARRS